MESRTRSLIDDVLPAFQFGERHSARVRAAPDRIFRAIRDVRPEEVRFLRLLMAIRSLDPGRFLGRGGSHGPPQPILDAALRQGFLALGEDRGRELVFGAVGRFWPGGGPRLPLETPEAFLAFDRPGYAKAAINFRVDDEGGGWSRVTTETRVAATDLSARRKFAAYWCVIYPGSALIRRMWLEAIRRRAESATA